MDYAVVDENNVCQGVLQITDLISSFMRPENEHHLCNIQCTLQSLKMTIQASVLNCGRDQQKLTDFKMVIPTMDLNGFKVVSEKWTYE